MLMFVIQHQPHRAGTDLRRELVACLLAHGSTFSRVGASGKPGAVHRATKVDNAKAAKVASKVSANVFRTLNYRPRSRPGGFLCIAEGGETAVPALRRA